MLRPTSFAQQVTHEQPHTRLSSLEQLANENINAAMAGAGSIIQSPQEMIFSAALGMWIVEFQTASRLYEFPTQTSFPARDVRVMKA